MTKNERKAIAYKILLYTLDKEQTAKLIMEEFYPTYTAETGIQYKGYKDASKILEQFNSIVQDLEATSNKLERDNKESKRREQARGYYNRLLRKAKTSLVWYEQEPCISFGGSGTRRVEKQDEEALKQLYDEIKFTPIYKQALAEHEGYADHLFFDTFKEVCNEEFRRTGWYDIEEEPDKWI